MTTVSKRPKAAADGSIIGADLDGDGILSALNDAAKDARIKTRKAIAKKYRKKKSDADQVQASKMSHSAKPKSAMQSRLDTAEKKSAKMSASAVSASV